MVYPLIVLILIIICVIIFFCLMVSPYLPSSGHDITASVIINWIIFSLLLVMTLWSQSKLVFSTPGFIPPGYSKYDAQKMHPHDRLVFRYLRESLHSTVRQAIDALETGTLGEGSVRASRSIANDPF